MKTFATSLLLFVTALLLGQTPQAINYQAVARDASNNILSNKNIGIRISVLAGSSTGTSVYSETHNTTTNSSGIFSVEIGRGSVVGGSFPNIQWYSQPHFAKIEIDVNSGTNYQLVGTTQFLSVPYALFAENTAMIFRVNSRKDTIVVTNQRTININTPCELVDWIGGEVEDIVLSANGFNSKIYPINISFPYTITSSMFLGDTDCGTGMEIFVDSTTPSGIYPIEFIATNSRGRQKKGVMIIKNKDCVWQSESYYSGTYPNTSLKLYLNGLDGTVLGAGPFSDTIQITNPVNNDNKINISSKFLKINNIQLNLDSDKIYKRDSVSISEMRFPSEAFGEVIFQNLIINIRVSTDCYVEDKINVTYNVISGTSNINTGLIDLRNLSGKNLSLRAIITK